MALFALVGLVVALVLIGVGIAIGLVACAIGGFLVCMGVFSSSVFVGVHSGRLALALRVFLLQCGVLAGLPAGAVGAWLAHSFFASLDQATWTLLCGGALGGVVGGLLVALLLDSCLRGLHRWAAKLHPTLQRKPVDGISVELAAHSAGSRF